MTKEYRMTVIAVHPLQKPEVIEIDNTLESLQEFVGGTIDFIYPFADEVGLVVNDEGKILGLPLNRALRSDGKIYDIIAGSFLVVALKGENEGSLSQAQQDKYLKFFETPEMFVKINGKLLVLPC